MESMPAARAAHDPFHPLELIPAFRRIPRSPVRDFAFTFLWNDLFALAFMAVGVMFSGRLPTWSADGIYVLIANIVGYSIHFLFLVGSRSGLEGAAKARGFWGKVGYYTLVPLGGVMLGFLAASFVIDRGFRAYFASPSALLSIVSSTMVISVVLSAIFFWRERSAKADAALARERERAERIEREAALANLRALQAQIEPHFLFNTLANVASLIDTQPALARRMVESFNRFLRASLAATRSETTTLAEEGRLIGAFLDVLQVRMGKRLAYSIDIPEALGSFPLPPMLLQPVVENAIKHGLEPKVEGGAVALRAREEGGDVVIEVADTGVGFAPTTRGGVGLSNLRSRVGLLYGGRARVDITENAPAGTRVSLRLPR